MSYLTSDADQQNSTENDDSDDETGIDARIDLFDKAALIMGPKNVINHILENGDVPENSPLRDELDRLQDIQKKNYESRVENYDISLPEYLEEMGWPDCEMVIDPDKFREDGLKVHPDYGNDGKCYADPPANHDGYPIPSDYTFPAFYAGDDDSAEDDEQESTTEGGNGEQPLDSISGIGEAMAEKVEEQIGVANLREARHCDPVDPDTLPGIGERTLRKLHIDIQETENDGEGGDENMPDGITYTVEDSDDDDDNTAESSGDAPDFIQEAVENNPEVLAEMDPEQIRALKE